MEMSCVAVRGECRCAAAAAWLMEVWQGGGFRAGKGICCSLMPLACACFGDYLSLRERPHLWVLTRKPERRGGVCSF
jgi:hypothetical protein